MMSVTVQIDGAWEYENSHGYGRHDRHDGSMMEWESNTHVTAQCHTSGGGRAGNAHVTRVMQGAQTTGQVDYTMKHQLAKQNTPAAYG